MAQQDGLRAAVGERLRRARVAHGLSVGALAARAGVGKGSLSEIEHGSRNPTLSTLYALANTLEVPLSELLADRPGTEVASPGITARLLESTTDAEGTVEVYALTLEPGAVHVSAAHGPHVVEHLLVTRGAARVGRAGAETDLTTGAGTAWTSDTEHTYRALDGRPAAAVLVVRTAAGGEPRTP
ncbi:Transcriptional regulator, contains XRE-family HTH domain [Pseudonocardia ammonioxydans]|uniref:Transcriptional regulator, contains XRE-family HTH domain n=1 Tax=Pseudonocardia ammonioxydans TaxID=260086 RepID=A0A1I4WDK4_PSUAM|nr:helix-turn-helix transcriptional regulator [Pseudonocardia ammonioxydans]SFN11851.1 Transcriptional regulator, contains XRE-family HTH domain [Pseudonocardia ammonioxydans]